MRRKCEEYPYNLLNEIFGSENDIIEEIKRDKKENNLNYIMCYLSPMQYKVIIEYFCRKETLESIGDRNGFSKQYAWSIRNIAVKRLKKYRNYILANSVKLLPDKAEGGKEEEKRCLDVTFVVLCKYLSNRTNNALKRWNRDNYEEITVEKLNEMTEKEMIKEIRSIGATGAAEVKSAIKVYIEQKGV